MAEEIKASLGEFAAELSSALAALKQFDRAGIKTEQDLAKFHIILQQAAAQLTKISSLKLKAPKITVTEAQASARELAATVRVMMRDVSIAMKAGGVDIDAELSKIEKRISSSRVKGTLVPALERGQQYAQERAEKAAKPKRSKVERQAQVEIDAEVKAFNKRVEGLKKTEQASNAYFIKHEKQMVQAAKSEDEKTKKAAQAAVDAEVKKYDKQVEGLKKTEQASDAYFAREEEKVKKAAQAAVDAEVKKYDKQVEGLKKTEQASDAYFASQEKIKQQQVNATQAGAYYQKQQQALQDVFQRFPNLQGKVQKAQDALTTALHGYNKGVEEAGGETKSFDETLKDLENNAIDPNTVGASKLIIKYKELQRTLQSTAGTRNVQNTFQNINQQLLQSATNFGKYSQAQKMQIMSLMTGISQTMAAMNMSGTQQLTLIQGIQQGNVGALSTNKTLTNQVRQLNSAIQGAQKSTETFTLGWENFQRLILARLVTAVFYRLWRQMEEGIQVALDVSKAIGEIQTISQDAKVSTEEWASAIQDLSGRYNFLQTDIAEALYQTISNQVAFGKTAIQFLDQIAPFAKATASSLADSVELTSSVINSFGIDVTDVDMVLSSLFKTIELGRVRASEMAQSYGRIGPVAKMLGLSLNELNGTITVTTRSGLKFERASTFVLNVMNKLIKPSKEMQAVLQSWGFTSGQAAIRALGLVGVIQRLATESEGVVGELFQEFRDLRASQGAVLLTQNVDTLRNDIDKLGNSMDYLRKAEEGIFLTSGEKVTREFHQVRLAFENMSAGVIDFIANFEKLPSYINPLRLSVDDLSDALEVLGTLLLPVVGLAGLGKIVGWFASAVVSGEAAATAVRFMTLRLGTVGLAASGIYLLYKHMNSLDLSTQSVNKEFKKMLDLARDKDLARRAERNKELREEERKQIEQTEKAAIGLKKQEAEIQAIMEDRLKIMEDQKDVNREYTDILRDMIKDMDEFNTERWLDNFNPTEQLLARTEFLANRLHEIYGIIQTRPELAPDLLKDWSSDATALFKDFERFDDDMNKAMMAYQQGWMWGDPRAFNRVETILEKWNILPQEFGPILFQQVEEARRRFLAMQGEVIQQVGIAGGIQIPGIEQLQQMPIAMQTMADLAGTTKVLKDEEQYLTEATRILREAFEKGIFEPEKLRDLFAAERQGVQDAGNQLITIFTEMLNQTVAIRTGIEKEQAKSLAVQKGETLPRKMDQLYNVLKSTNNTIIKALNTSEKLVEELPKEMRDIAPFFSEEARPTGIKWTETPLGPVWTWEYAKNPAYVAAKEQLQRLMQDYKELTTSEQIDIDALYKLQQRVKQFYINMQTAYAESIGPLTELIDYSDLKKIRKDYQEMEPAMQEFARNLGNLQAGNFDRVDFSGNVTVTTPNKVQINAPGVEGVPTTTLGLARGGTIGGPRGTDTVPAWLTPGEFVVNARSTQKYMPLLQMLNARGFAEGGKVTREQLNEMVLLLKQERIDEDELAKYDRLMTLLSLRPEDIYAGSQTIMAPRQLIKMLTRLRKGTKLVRGAALWPYEAMAIVGGEISNFVFMGGAERLLDTVRNMDQKGIDVIATEKMLENLSTETFYSNLMRRGYKEPISFEKMFSRLDSNKNSKTFYTDLLTRGYKEPMSWYDQNMDYYSPLLHPSTFIPKYMSEDAARRRGFREQSFGKAVIYKGGKRIDYTEDLWRRQAARETYQSSAYNEAARAMFLGQPYDVSSLPMKSKAITYKDGKRRDFTDELRRRQAARETAQPTYHASTAMYWLSRVPPQVIDNTQKYWDGYEWLTIEQWRARYQGTGLAHGGIVSNRFEQGGFVPYTKAVVGRFNGPAQRFQDGGAITNNYQISNDITLSSTGRETLDAHRLVGAINREIYRGTLAVRNGRKS